MQGQLWAGSRRNPLIAARTKDSPLQDVSHERPNLGATKVGSTTFALARKTNCVLRSTALVPQPLVGGETFPSIQEMRLCGTATHPARTCAGRPCPQDNIRGPHRVDRGIRRPAMGCNVAGLGGEKRPP
jgi:hypothetical protein